MSCESYNVLINGLIVAEGMSLGHALIFVKALFVEYYNDTDMSVAIEREKPNETFCGPDPRFVNDIVNLVREDAEARRDEESKQI